MKLASLVVALLALPRAHADAAPSVVKVSGALTVDAEVTIDVDAGVTAGSTSPAPEPVTVDGSASSHLEIAPSAAGSDSDDNNPLLAPHWEASIGMTIPTELGGPGPGLVASLGRQVGALRLSGEYMQLARDSNGPGMNTVRCLTRAHRLGATARYRVAYGAGIAAFGAYVEGGIGRETYTTKVGPAVSRSVAIGVGFESLVGGRAGAAGFDMGYRASIDVDDGATAHLITVAMLLGR